MRLKEHLHTGAPLHGEVLHVVARVQLEEPRHVPEQGECYDGQDVDHAREAREPAEKNILACFQNMWNMKFCLCVLFNR